MHNGKLTSGCQRRASHHSCGLHNIMQSRLHMSGNAVEKSCLTLYALKCSCNCFSCYHLTQLRRLCVACKLRQVLRPVIVKHKHLSRGARNCLEMGLRTAWDWAINATATAQSSKQWNQAAQACSVRQEHSVCQVPCHTLRLRPAKCLLGLTTLVIWDVGSPQAAVYTSRHEQTFCSTRLEGIASGLPWLLPYSAVTFNASCAAAIGLVRLQA